MKKDLAIIGGLFLLIVGLVIFGGNYSAVSFFKPPSGESVSKSKTATLRVKTLGIGVEVAANSDERKKGLGGRDSLEISRGMLFAFETSDIWPIWMKNMKFPIDIIWIGEDKKIVFMAQNALPEPKKKDQELFVYKPDANAKYILEINAGLSAIHNLEVGDQVDFDI